MIDNTTLYPLKCPRMDSIETGSQAKRAVLASRSSIILKFLGAFIGTVDKIDFNKQINKQNTTIQTPTQ